MGQLNVYLLLGISMLITLTYVVIRNLYSKKYIVSDASYYSFNFWTSLCSAAVLAALSGGQLTGSVYSVLLGVAFGVLTLLAAVFNMKALSIGPMAYTIVITTASMMIPTLSGRIFWNESVSVWQYIGIAVMLVSVVCAINTGAGERKASAKWLILCLLTFVCSGGIGVMQKVHQSSGHGAESMTFLITAFVTSAVLSGIVFFVKRPRAAVTSPKPSALLIFMTVISGVFIALANQINLYLSGAMDSAVFFPIVNGGGMLLAALAGIVFFGERFTRRQWLGMALGGAAVLLLCK